MPEHASAKLRRYQKARKNGRWTETILRALSSRLATRRWRLVSFRGPARGEARGIVDLLAIRKDLSRPRHRALKRGDLLEMVLIQCKGGSGGIPGDEERRRLREVKKRAGARAVVLFRWRKGKDAQFSALSRKLEWEPTSVAQVFGERPTQSG